MKVLKVGRDHRDWTSVVECERCGATLEISRDDLFTVPNKAGAHLNAIDICVICGWCKKQFVVQEWANYLWGKLPTKEDFSRKGDG